MLNPTPPDKLCDLQGRPYFLWDNELRLAELEEKLRSRNPEEQLYWMGILLRQAKPDDAIVLVGRDAIRLAVPKLRGRLGHTEAMWTWLVTRWGARD